MMLLAHAWTLAQQTPDEPQAVPLLDFVLAGGVIGGVIIALSVVALALVVMHLVQIRAAAFAPPELVTELDELLHTGEPKADAALELCAEPANRCMLTAVLGAGLDRARRSALGALELRSSMEEAAAAEVARFYRSTDALALIAAIAPMLGLLGTVVGINGAFGTISSTEGFARQEQLAGDISLALTTTIMGLVLAIPATAGVTFFRNRIDGLAQLAGDEAERLAAPVEQHAD
ncbi:MAG: MotA/TolQ/ExbB proton channel family protein [Planctomycetota bacterium]